MQYICSYDSPLGKMLLVSSIEGLEGVYFVGQKHFPAKTSIEKCKVLDLSILKNESEILLETKTWLDMYFAGAIPDFTPLLHFIGSDFQKKVWSRLCKIPYGKSASYKDIATNLSCPIAVGQAVGRNKISLIVPCHRVIGANKELRGYAAGIKRKKWLLELENTVLLHQNHFLDRELNLN